MKRTNSLSLKIWLPIIALIILTSLWFVTAWVGYINIKSALVKSSIAFVQQDLRSLQSYINRGLAGEHPHDAWQALSSRGTVIEYQLLVALDDNGKILHSTNLAYVDHYATEVISEFNQHRFEELKKLNRPDYITNNNQHIISAYLPILLERRKDEIRRFKVGALLAIYNFSKSHENLWLQVWNSNWPIGVVLLMAMLILICFLQRYVNAPIEHLREISNRLRRNNREPILVKIEGSGELAELSQSFNKMHEQLIKRLDERDSTERKLKESHRQLELVLESTGVGTWDWQVTLDIVNINARWAEILGYKYDELAPLSYVNLKNMLHADDLEVFDQLLIYSDRFSDDQFTFESKMKHHSGHWLWVMVTVKVIEWSVGKHPERLIGTLQNINERKIAEKELLDNATRFERWKASNFIGIIQSNREGKVIEANNTILNMLGYSRAELLSGDIDWLSMTPPEYLHLDEQALIEADKKGYWTAFEKEYFHKQGHRVPIIIGGSIFKEEAEEYIVFIVDISIQKRVEKALSESDKKFRALYDNAPDMYASVSINGNDLLLCNETLLKKTGYCRKELIGNPIFKLFDKRNHPRVKQLLKQFTRVVRIRDDHLPILIKNGSRLEVSLSIEAVKDECDNTLYLMLSWRDLSDFKKAEKSLQRAQKMEALGQLSGGIAHDFNNMLGVILGNVELLEQTLLISQDASNRLCSIKKSTLRAAVLTRRLLAFSRRPNNISKISDVNQLINGMESLIERSLTPDITVEYHLLKNAYKCNINPGDFEDALLNMVINSRDAMNGRGRVSIETSNKVLNDSFCNIHPSVVPGEYLCVSISDTGQGIDSSIIDNIFEPFFSTKEKEEGTGLGLAMVFGFVHRSSGCITAHSEDNLGAQISLYFPRSTKAIGEQIIQSDLKSIEAEPLSLGDEHILVVDDEEELRSYCCSTLESLGYRVTLAEDAEEALIKLKKLDDIVLLFSDVVLPGGMNGFELAEKAHRKQPNLKILLTSGYTGQALAKQGQSELLANLLNKPYTKITLSQNIRMIIDKCPAFIDELRTNQFNTSLWHADMSIGVEEMDSDHEQLLRIIDEVNQMIHESTEESKISYLSILNRLDDYTDRHFEREERLMSAVDYPGLKNHMAVHNLFRQKVKRMRHEFEQAQVDRQALSQFLSNWWIEHIQIFDRAYVAYCIGKEKLLHRVLQGNDYIAKPRGKI